MRCPDCGSENMAGEEACQACGTPLSSSAQLRTKAHGPAERRVLEGTLRDLSPVSAVSVPAERPAADAVELMREHKTGCVLVTREGRLAGIFTERDLLLCVAGLRDPRRTPVGEVMKPDPQCLSEDDTIAYAFHNMALMGHRHIPVTRKDRSYGIISSRDLLRYLCR